MSKKKNSNNRKRKKQEKAVAVPPLKENEEKPIANNKLSFIVAIGASAGGLDALKTFFRHSKANEHFAFIIITHLSPDHISMLPELIQQYTDMRVVSIQNNIEVEGNHVYVLPPGKNILIQKGILIPIEQREKELHLPIDFFLRSLAIDEGERAICIILSGTGSDGTMGLRALREKNGLVIVQNPKSARYDAMPKSAISTGLVDYILPPEKMFEFLEKYLEHDKDKTTPIEKSIAEETQQVLKLLHNQTGHDFSSYKTNTIFRRMQKRMNILQIDSLTNYIHFLHLNSQEIEILFEEILINVTNFFRDPVAFESLKAILIKTILKNKPDDYNLRVWVPGCATGEEVFSIAIILQECMEKLQQYFNVQIFGTDIDEMAIEKARSGIFSTNIETDVSAERLNRYFVRVDNYYKINSDIRKMIIFAVQNVTKDPPFTKLDLLSCRNLLIYFNSQLQKKILPLFHYSLVPHGILFLGTSETIGGSSELFNIIDGRWKIFERKGVATNLQSVMDFPSPPSLPETSYRNTDKNMQQNEKKLALILEHILLESYAPPCIIIDDNENLVYIHGKTSSFLEFASGEVRLQIMDMIRVELRTKLSTAIRKVQSQKKEFILKGLQIKEGNEFKYLTVRVRPLYEPAPSNRKLMLIIFEDMRSFAPTQLRHIKPGTKNGIDNKIIELEQELKFTKESLQTTIEELETSNEELKSSNEELQSTNEELQSTNEEIETSKEELQSLNEELTTVNAELESRIEQLSSANDDIKNLLDNTEIATIFLDKDLCVKRFTPKATDIINLILTDVGRPLSHIVTNLQYENLIDDATFVMKTLQSKTTEAMDKSGHWYVIRIIPYRTVSNLIDGVVITFHNIHLQKRLERDVAHLKKELQQMTNIAKSMMNLSKDPILLIDNTETIIAINDDFIKQFKLDRKELIGTNLSASMLKWDYKKIKDKLLTVAPNEIIDNFIVSNNDSEELLNVSITTLPAGLILFTIKPKK